MATVRLAAASLLTTVQTTAGTVNDILSTVSTGAKMMNDFVDDARRKQKLNLALGQVGYEETILNAKMIEIDQVQEQSEAYMAADEKRRDRCKIIHEKLTQALAQAKG